MLGGAEDSLFSAVAESRGAFFVLCSGEDKRKVCAVRAIREWLEKGGQDYAQGVALYKAHGKSRVVLRSLEYGATDFTHATLRRELEKLAGKCHATASETATKVFINPPEPTPPDDLRRQRSTWFAERDRLHAQLELVATDAERRRMAERILVLAEQLAASYAGEGPAVPVAAPRPDLGGLTDAGEIRRLLANLRPQASKLKLKPARAADLAQAQADIKLLETKLEKRDGGEPQL